MFSFLEFSGSVTHEGLFAKCCNAWSWRGLLANTCLFSWQQCYGFVQFLATASVGRLSSRISHWTSDHCLVLARYYRIVAVLRASCACFPSILCFYMKRPSVALWFESCWRWMGDVVYVTMNSLSYEPPSFVCCASKYLRLMAGRASAS